MNVAFDRLVRFRASDGQIYHGEAGSNWEAELRGQNVETFTGQGPWDSQFHASGERAEIAEVSERGEAWSRG